MSLRSTLNNTMPSIGPNGMPNTRSVKIAPNTTIFFHFSNIAYKKCCAFTLSLNHIEILAEVVPLKVVSFLQCNFSKKVAYMVIISFATPIPKKKSDVCLFKFRRKFTVAFCHPQIFAKMSVFPAIT